MGKARPGFVKRVGDTEYVAIHLADTTRNVHKVPVKQWRKWNAVARAVFNQLYGAMKESPWVFQSPTIEKMKLATGQWKVTAWNASWEAACAVMDALKGAKRKAA